MKARIAIIVILAGVILVQISYLVKRISSRDYSVPVIPTAGGPARPANAGGGPPPGGQPVANAPQPDLPKPASGVPASVPSGMPRPGAMPSGAPGLAAGNPPGGAQPPMGTAPSSVSLSVDMLPYNELLSALVAMQGDPSLALSDEQKAKMKPALEALDEIVKKNAGGPQQVAQIAVDTLRADQLEYLVKHRTDPPPLDAVALGTGPPGPAAVGVAAVKILERRAAENDGKPASSSGKAEPGQMMLGPEDLLGGILKLEADKSLSLTTAQAKALLGPIDAMVKSSAAVSAQTKTIVSLLSDAQKKYVLTAHEGYLSNAGGGSAAPPEQMLAELRKQL